MNTTESFKYKQLYVTKIMVSTWTCIIYRPLTDTVPLAHGESLNYSIGTILVPVEIKREIRMGPTVESTKILYKYKYACTSLCTFAGSGSPRHRKQITTFLYVCVPSTKICPNSGVTRAILVAGTVPYNIPH
jgi:hypothetical protein